MRKSNDLTIQSAMHGAKNTRLKTLEEVREEHRPQKLDATTTKAMDDAMNNIIKEKSGGR